MYYLYVCHAFPCKRQYWESLPTTDMPYCTSLHAFFTSLCSSFFSRSFFFLPTCIPWENRIIWEEISNICLVTTSPANSTSNVKINAKLRKQISNANKFIVTQMIQFALHFRTIAYRFIPFKLIRSSNVKLSDFSPRSSIFYLNSCPNFSIVKS